MGFHFGQTGRASASSRADGLFAPPRRADVCLVAAILFTVALSVLLVMNDVGRGPDDDLGIAMVLSGLYPDSGQCPFTNALLNDCIYALNLTVPTINWMLVIERLSAAVALFAAVYGLLRYGPWGVSLAVIGFISFLVYPLCTVSANFTAVGALCVFSGEMFVALSVLRRCPTQAAAGIGLMALGFMWRANVLLLSLPFFFAACGVLLLSLRKKNRSPQWRGRLMIVGACVTCILVVVGALSLYNHAVWSKPELARWSDYSQARSRLCDYPVKPYDEIASELDDLGVSENDYWCMTHWITADPDFFTVERLRAVADVAAKDAGKTVPGALKSEARSLLTKRVALLAGLILMTIVICLRGGRKAAVLLVLSGALCFTVCIYFRYIGRFPVRVEYSAWMFALLPSVVYFFARSFPSAPSALSGEGVSRLSSRSGRCHRAATAIGGAALALACGTLAVWYGPTLSARSVAQFEQESTFAASRPLIEMFQEVEGVSIWDPYSFPFVERELLYRCLPPRSFMEHTTFAGGWTAGSPLMARHNEELGVSNPLRSLAERSDVRFVTSKKAAAKHVRCYLREHYAPHIKMRIERKIPVASQKKNGDNRTLYVVSFQAPSA